MRSAFRSSKFRGGSSGLGEDVNPSAYIVNLADCMLVLACGFMVAMIGFWQIDINTSAKEIDTETMQEVDPEVIPEDLTEAGSEFVEAGIVYVDPATGAMYMVNKEDAGVASSEGSSTSGGSEGSSTSGGSTEGSTNTGSSTSSGAGSSEDSIRDARASGAD